jgi:hypothetical protein
MEERKMVQAIMVGASTFNNYVGKNGKNAGNGGH